jgi:hypothetical protein
MNIVIFTNHLLVLSERYPNGFPFGCGINEQCIVTHSDFIDVQDETPAHWAITAAVL